MTGITLREGSLLKHGEYRIVRVLGQGGFGITYEAVQVALGRKVAVKEFFMKDCCERDEQTSRITIGTGSQRELVEKFRSKFIREAQMIAAMDHRNIVRIYDVFEENDTAYYVMENLPGGSLSDKVKKEGPFSEAEAEKYIRQVASALSYIHAHKTVHLDVKPSNILLNKNGEAVLIDFGISKHYDTAGEQTSSTPVGISKGYAPLEQGRDGDVSQFTPATDIYALGATLYFLVTGQAPPEATLVYEDGLDRPAGVSDRMWQAIVSAMQPRRKDRPQSIAEFLTLLDTPATAATAPDDTVILSDSEESNRARKKFPSWLIALASTIVVALVVWLVIPKKQPKPAEPVNPVIAIEAPVQPVEVPVEKAKPEVIPVTKIALNKTSLSLEEGKSETLKLTYTPSNATDKTTTWQSNNTAVATVDKSGKVTARKAGAASITATCGGLSVTCTLTVTAAAPQVVPVTSIQLNKTSLNLEEGKSETLKLTYTPSNATDKTTTWQSNNTSVATVDSSGKVTARKAGAASITATCGSHSATCTVSVTASSATTGSSNGHEWVDLGLSVKWATCNVGASSPGDYGNYYAWGETNTKSDYSWTNYKFRTSGDSYDNVTFSKYNTKSGRGVLDNKTRLDYSDDAARQNWGGRWRMPTDAEWTELRNNCTWTWTSQGGHNGYKVTSKTNGNSIFLPAAGYRYGSSLSYAGSYGIYWSSSLDSDSPWIAWRVGFDSSGVYRSDSIRCYGYSVRPVTE